MKLEDLIRALMGHVTARTSGQPVEDGGEPGEAVDEKTAIAEVVNALRQHADPIFKAAYNVGFGRGAEHGKREATAEFDPAETSTLRETVTRLTAELEDLRTKAPDAAKARADYDAALAERDRKAADATAALKNQLRQERLDRARSEFKAAGIAKGLEEFYLDAMFDRAIREGRVNIVETEEDTIDGKRVVARFEVFERGKRVPMHPVEGDTLGLAPYLSEVDKAAPAAARSSKVDKGSDLGADGGSGGGAQTADEFVEARNERMAARPNPLKTKTI